MNALNRLARLTLLVFALAGGVAAQDVAQESRADIMRRLVNEVYTGASDDLLATAFASDFLWIGPGDRPVTMAEWRDELDAFATALPDLHSRTLELLTDGSWAASLVQLNGTFEAPLDWRGQQQAPTGEPVEWIQLDFVRFSDDRRADYGYSERDMRGLMAQFGAGQAGPHPVEASQAASAASAALAGQAAQASAAASPFTQEDEDRFARTLDGFLEAALVGADVDTLAPYFSDDFVLHRALGEGTLDDLNAWLTDIATALPGATLETPVVMFDEDYGAARIGIRGDFTGEWGGEAEVTVPPNGQPIVLTANLLLRFNRDAEITALWLVYDRDNWAMQFTAPPVP